MNYAETIVIVRLLEPGDPSERINPQPCVPAIVTTCIRFIHNTLWTYRGFSITIDCLQIPGAARPQHRGHLQGGNQSEASAPGAAFIPP